MLNIALLGACPAQLSELAAALEQAANAQPPQMMRLTVADAGALPDSFAGFDLVLLAGLETFSPAQCMEVPGAVPEDLQAADRLIRAALALAGVSYRVLYGTASERLAHALHAMQGLLPAASRARQASRPGDAKKPIWTWMCDKCGDPGCEHRLLTALLAQRDSASSTPGKQAVRPYSISNSMRD